MRPGTPSSRPTTMPADATPDGARLAARAVIDRRRAERAERIAIARSFSSSLDVALGVRAVVVFGSVARGDFNVWSDIDVLVVAERLPDGALARADVIGPTPAGVQAVVWTPDEFRRRHVRNDPIAVEAVGAGVWLVGRPVDLGLEDA